MGVYATETYTFHLCYLSSYLKKQIRSTYIAAELKSSLHTYGKD